MANIGKSWQKLPNVAKLLLKFRQKLAKCGKVANCCKKGKKVAKSSQPLANIGKSCQILQKIRKSWQILLKVGRTWQKLPNVAKNCQKLSKAANRRIATYSYDPYIKHNDQNDNRFCWNSIITQCNLPLSNYGRPLHPKLPPTRMTHIPSTMIKMTTDIVETSSLSSVTYHCQITVVHCTPNWHLLVWPIYQAQW